ncbi:MAG: hypothetical protein JWN40_2409 [Phycisphaerales bacterium]|nr:hypothetical protein [Phycisphaerales bacterium]
MMAEIDDKSDCGKEFIPSADKRHPEVFELLHVLRDKLCLWIDNGDLDNPSTPLEWVKIAVCVRTYNIFKAAIALLERDFWEDALILIRTLFELLLNVEELLRSETEQEKRAGRFILFEKLQTYLKHVALIEYNLQMERPLKRPEAYADVQLKAKRLFSSFIVGTKNGKVKWAKSWHGRNVWELAEASKNPMRTGQYKTLYAYCSALVHASPAAVLSTNIEMGSEMEWEGVTEKRLNDDKEGIMLTVGFLAQFSFEVLLLAGSVLPKFDASVGFEVFERICKMYGVTPPMRGVPVTL